MGESTTEYKSDPILLESNAGPLVADVKNKKAAPIRAAFPAHIAIDLVNAG